MEQRMKTREFLEKYDDCTERAQWMLSISDEMSEVYDRMIIEKRWAWLMWTISRPDVFEERVLRKLALRFVMETVLPDGRTIWDQIGPFPLTDTAMYLVSKYVDGRASDEELHRASFLVSDADNDYIRSPIRNEYIRIPKKSWELNTATTAAAAVDIRRGLMLYIHNSDKHSKRLAGNIWDDDGNTVFHLSQLRMISELGNPFRTKEPSTVKQWSKHYVARVLRFAEKNDGDWNEECPTEEKGLEVPVYGDADLIAAAPKLLATLESVCAEMDYVLKMIRLTKGRGYSSDQALLEMHEFIKETILKVNGEAK